MSRVGIDTTTPPQPVDFTFFFSFSLHSYKLQFDSINKNGKRKRNIYHRQMILRMTRRSHEWCYTSNVSIVSITSPALFRIARNYWLLSILNFRRSFGRFVHFDYLHFLWEFGSFSEHGNTCSFVVDWFFFIFMDYEGTFSLRYVMFQKSFLRGTIYSLELIKT